MDKTEVIGIILLFVAGFCTGAMITIIHDYYTSPQKVLPVTNISYEQNCNIKSKLLLKSLLDEGFNVTKEDVWVPHTMVRCSDCGDYVIWFEPNGEINYHANENYIMHSKITEHNISGGLE